MSSIQSNGTGMTLERRCDAFNQKCPVGAIVLIQYTKRTQMTCTIVREARINNKWIVFYTDTGIHFEEDLVSVISVTSTPHFQGWAKREGVAPINVYE